MPNQSFRQLVERKPIDLCCSSDNFIGFAERPGHTLPIGNSADKLQHAFLSCFIDLRATEPPCSKSGHVLWHFLSQGNRHSLTVLSVEKKYLGVYACHAANAYGADSKKIEVSGENCDSDDCDDNHDAKDCDDNDDDNNAMVAMTVKEQ